MDLERAARRVVEYPSISWRDVMWLPEDLSYSGSSFVDFDVDDTLRDFGLTYYNGASKLVIYDPELPDVVVKIPFQGISHHGDDKQFFTGAMNGEWDYLYDEEQFYELARCENLEHMFCGTQFLCYLNDYPIYVQEKAEDYLPHTKVSKESHDSAENTSDWWLSCDMEEATIALFYETYGKEDVDRLLEFLVDNRIRDCHDENVGTVNGLVRLFDYSGYYG